MIAVQPGLRDSENGMVDAESTETRFLTKNHLFLCFFNVIIPAFVSTMVTDHRCSSVYCRAAKFAIPISLPNAKLISSVELFVQRDDISRSCCPHGRKGGCLLGEVCSELAEQLYFAACLKNGFVHHVFAVENAQVDHLLAKPVNIFFHRTFSMP